jgi:hypothetical protein
MWDHVDKPLIDPAGPLGLAVALGGFAYDTTYPACGQS